MATVTIKSYTLVGPPGFEGRDAYRWRVWLEDDYLLIVDLSGTEAVRTGRSRSELHERLPNALQRLAAGRLDNERPVLDQIQTWDGPLPLAAEHFA